MTGTKKIIEKSISFRGEIIHDWTLLDCLLDIYIANNSGQNNRLSHDANDIRSNNSIMDFKSKVKILLTISAKNKNNLHELNPSFEEDCNLVAHELYIFQNCRCSFSKEALRRCDSYLGVIINEPEGIIWYSNETIQTIRTAIGRCVDAITDLVF